MSTFKNMNSLRTIEAQIVQKLENNEARPKFTGSYKKKRVYQPEVCSKKFSIKTCPFIWLKFFLQKEIIV